MPGGFHPFHAGHASLYQSALKAFPGAEVYVAATDDTKTRPFPFAIKEKLAKLAGVKPGHFIQVKSPFRPTEITDKYNPEQDVVIFVRSEKDRNESPKPGGMKKDGTPAYFQPYTGKDVQPFGQHAYFAYLPTVEFGPGIKSATEIRNAWPKLDDRRKTAMVMSLYPATQKNPKLAANVVKMLDMGMGNELTEDDAGDVEQRMIAKIAKEKQRLAKLKQTDPEAYNREMAKSKTSDRVPPVSTFEDQDVVEASVVDTIKKGAKKVWDYATEPVDAPNIETYKKHRAKNIANIRKNKERNVKEEYEDDLSEGPFVSRIGKPNKVNIYVRHDISKPALLIATDIPYMLYDKFIAKAIQKYPQFKQTDFSFKSADKAIAETDLSESADYLEEK